MARREQQVGYVAPSNSPLRLCLTEGALIRFTGTSLPEDYI
jgi:hypothetical protein